MIHSAPNIPRFIAGMSRSGTDWMTRLFNEHPDVASFGETGFWGRWYVEPNNNGSYDQHQLENQIRSLKKCDLGPIDTNPGTLRVITHQTRSQIVDRALGSLKAPVSPTKLFLDYCQAITVAEGKRLWIEKTPHHINWIDRIVHALPDAKIVIMIRDPYRFMLSYKHQGDRQKPRTQQEFYRLYHPLGCSLVWRGYMRAINYASAKYPQQILIISLDNVGRSLRQMIVEIQRFLQLEPVNDLADRVPATNTSFPGRRRPSLQSDDVFWMNLVAGRLMQRAGYRRQPVPCSLLPILLSILRLPIWAIRIVIKFRVLLSDRWIRYLWKWVHPPHTPSSGQPARSVGGHQ